tara:strand:- start:852 stop:1139 length:288 start_codon:yes stop_codon:yes gene_type:complete
MCGRMPFGLRAGLPTLLHFYSGKLSGKCLQVRPQSMVRRHLLTFGKVATGPGGDAVMMTSPNCKRQEGAVTRIASVRFHFISADLLRGLRAVSRY